jgi:hypothetical protein
VFNFPICESAMYTGDSYSEWVLIDPQKLNEVLERVRGGYEGQ